MATFDLSNQIRVLNPCANNDYLYGPYKSLDEAINTITTPLLTIGRTIGLIESGVIKEYWWQYVPAEEEGKEGKYEFVLKTCLCANDTTGITDIETITEQQIDVLFGDAYVEEMLKDLVPVFKDEFGTTEPTEPTEPTE